MPKTAKTDTANPIPEDIQALGFEEAMGELEDIVRSLEDGRGKLDDMITAYERGALLKQHCEALLKAAELRVEKIVLTENGPVSEPADLD